MASPHNSSSESAHSMLQQSNKSSSSGSSSQITSSSSSSDQSKSSGTSYGSVTTQSASEQELPSEDFEHDLDTEEWVWGFLYPKKTCLLKVELTKNTYTFGRSVKSEPNPITFTKTMFPDSYLELSSKHCAISYERQENRVYIKDFSRNGTYVNGRRVGKTLSHSLESGDVISFASPLDQAYLFINHENLKRERRTLPIEFRKKYKLLWGTLGRGACGEVRAGTELDTGMDVAVKIIQRKLSSLEVRDLCYEAALMISISEFPSVVKVYDLFESPEKIFIVMERVNGGELYQRVKSALDKKTLLPESTVKFWFYQLLKTVQYLHSKDITHRDLKPENVLLTSASRDMCLLKITDFGLSRIVCSGSMMETLVGTPNYTAPEILSGQRYNNACDLWSLGCLLYVCLVCQYPFVGQGQEVVLEKMLRGVGDLSEGNWKGISNDGKDMVTQLLKANPAERITVDDALEHPWLQDGELERNRQIAIEEFQSTITSHLGTADAPLEGGPSGVATKRGRSGSSDGNAMAVSAESSLEGLPDSKRTKHR